MAPPSDDLPPGGGEPRRTAPYGSWASRFPIEAATGSAIRLEEVAAAGGVRWWVEGRPDEGGRRALIRHEPDGGRMRLTPEGFDVRSRLHEYGGRSYAAAGDLVVVSDSSSGRLWRVVGPGVVRPLTPERAWRFADLEIDAARGRLLAVREDLEPSTLAANGEPVASLVSVDLAGGEVTTLVDGADFYAAPRCSPDGARLAWLEWTHPNMPWDGTTLRLAELDRSGRPIMSETVAGGPADWVSEPAWSPDGVLHYVAEPDGWMNIYRWEGGSAVNLTPLPAEFASPDWQPGFHTYGFAGDGSLVAAGRSDGRTRLYRIPPGGSRDGRTGGTPLEIPLPWTELTTIAVDGPAVVLCAGAPLEPVAVVEIPLDGGMPAILRRSVELAIAEGEISPGRHINFPTSGGETAHGFYYPPHSSSYRAPDGELPPLVVTAHGGPTSQASSELAPLLQVLTSRGFAVLDVDYRGSSGYGRAYRRRLEGEVGVIDVDDCCWGARWLAAEGLVDPERVAIRGQSHSGYLALAAATFRDDFRAAVSRSGFGDLEAIHLASNKFEAHYNERLVGPWPGARKRYRERSPFRHVDRVGCPILILHGLDDPVVPVAQAEQFVTALREQGRPHAFLTFRGEGHGFHGAEALRRAVEAELSFYALVFGIALADPIEPIALNG